MYVLFYHFSILIFILLSESDKENYALDQSTMCAEWSRLWSAFGFSEHQWLSRAAKVEEYTRVNIFLTLIKYSH